MTLPLPEMICSVGSKIFSSLMLILGAFDSALALFFAPFFLFDFFLLGSSPGRRMPMVFVGRSITWPMDALTVWFRPKYLLIVFAFAGDSTMTSERAM